MSTGKAARYPCKEGRHGSGLGHFLGRATWRRFIHCVLGGPVRAAEVVPHLNRGQGGRLETEQSQLATGQSVGGITSGKARQAMGPSLDAAPRGRGGAGLRFLVEGYNGGVGGVFLWELVAPTGGSRATPARFGRKLGGAPTRGMPAAAKGSQAFRSIV